jgi:LemA protein
MVFHHDLERTGVENISKSDANVKHRQLHSPEFLSIFPPVIQHTQSETPAMAFLVFLVLVILLVVWVIVKYNALITLRNQVTNGWKQIDVQLKRRHDLIPNLVNTVKGYMQFEQETLEKVISARNAAASATGVGNIAAKEGELSNVLSRLFALTENYPTLKANENVKQLQEELSSTENKIGFARQFYNDIATSFNIAQQVFPANIIAGMFGFQAAELFEVKDEAVREVPTVDLSLKK